MKPMTLKKRWAFYIGTKKPICPQAGNVARIQQITTLRRLHHTKTTSDDMGRAIEDAAAELNGVDYNSNEASLIRYLKRTYDDASKADR